MGGDDVRRLDHPAPAAGPTGFSSYSSLEADAQKVSGLINLSYQGLKAV